MKTTLSYIRKFDPCVEGWETFLRKNNKTQADDEDLPIKKILNDNGLHDAVWCLQFLDQYHREVRTFSAACVQHVGKYIINDSRKMALSLTSQYLNEQISLDVLDATWKKIRDEEVPDHLIEIYHSPAIAAWCVASFTLHVSFIPEQEMIKEKEWQSRELERVCECIEKGIEPYSSTYFD